MTRPPAPTRPVEFAPRADLASRDHQIVVAERTLAEQIGVA